MKTDKEYVKNIGIGTKVNTFFAVARKDFKTKKNGEPFIAVSLSDKTGSINAVIWDNVQSAKDILNENNIVRVAGDVGDYSGPQLTVRTIQACAPGEFDISDLIRSVDNIDALEEKVRALLSKIKNKDIRRLIEAIWNDKDTVGKFKKAPGGWKWHHAYFGGLFEHTYEVMELADRACDLHKEADRDLCLAGAFIHDIGKVFELSYDLSFEYTDSGRLIGHIVQGNDYVIGVIKGLKDFPEGLATQIQHILLSHQGEYEQRSPVLPQTLEACIVYHCDHLDSQANAFKSVIFGPREEGQKWSKWLTIIDRQLLLKDAK